MRDDAIEYYRSHYCRKQTLIIWRTVLLTENHHGRLASAVSQTTLRIFACSISFILNTTWHRVAEHALQDKIWYKVMNATGICNVVGTGKLTCCSQYTNGVTTEDMHLNLFIIFKLQCVMIAFSNGRPVV